MYTFGTNMHSLDTKMYFLKGYTATVTAFVATFFSESEGLQHSFCNV